MIRHFFQDARYGVRMLRRRPGLTLVAIITLALGIGANVAIFSVLMAVLVQPLPYRDAERLVWLETRNPALGVDGAFLNPADILDFRAQAQSFEHIASWVPLLLNLSGAASPERLEGIYVTTNFLRTLGVQPLLGRDFNAADGAPDSGSVIISYALWQRQFGGSPDVIGRKIKLGGPADRPPTGTVVGVMPAKMNFPMRIDLWMAEDYGYTDVERGGTHYTRTIAKLKHNVTIEQAQSEVNAIARTQAELYPKTNADWEVAVVAFREHLFGNTNIALPLLFGAVAFVLLIACANVANLQLARAASCRKEIAVRLALGAGRGRIIKQLLIESLLLAVAGSALGLLLAIWGIDLLRALGPDALPRVQEAQINAPALWFTAVLCALTSVVFGLVPAWQASKPDVQKSLKGGTEFAAAPQRHHRLRGALIISQIALALVLLIGAGLLVKSFWKLLSVNPGFEAANVLTAGVSLSFTDYPNDDSARRTNFFRRALERLSSLPGVEAVGAISHLPLGGRTMQLLFTIKGSEHGAEALADYRVVTPAFFETLRVPIKSGRVFTERDTSHSPFVYVVNESFARTYLPGRNPLNEKLTGGSFLPAGEIIGVVADIKHRELESDARPAFYISYLQHSTLPIMNFVMRTAVDPHSLEPIVHRELQSLDADQVVFNVKPLDDFLSAAVAQRKFNVLLLGLFAIMAMILAAAGIYGVMAYAVSLRTREIGIRVALGAQGGDVLKLVLKQGMILALLGVAIGLTASLALTRIMTSMLYGVSAIDFVTFTLVPIILGLVALAACYIPARRATKVDPLTALRYE